MPANADRHLGDHEIGKYLIGARDGGRKNLAAKPVEGPEQRADQHEGGPDRQAQCGAHLNATQSRAIGLGGEVTLHNGLIGCVLLEVVEEAVESHGPESGTGKVETEAAETGLVIGGDQMEHGAGTGVRRKQKQKDERDGDAGQQQEALDDVGPDDGAQAADEGVKDGDDTEADDERNDRPTGKARNGERQQIKDEAHLGEVPGGKGEGRIHADARAETLAEVFVDRHGNCVAEEWHDDRTHRTR